MKLIAVVGFVMTLLQYRTALNYTSGIMQGYNISPGREISIHFALQSPFLELQAISIQFQE